MVIALRTFQCGCFTILFLILVFSAAAWAKEPAIVLTAFGTTTAAADTYRHIEAQVRERYPGAEIRWAFTSQVVRREVAQEQGKNLKSLPQVLKELKAAGFTRIAVQSLHVVPGKEWEEVVQESRQVPGIKVAVGKPLLSDASDEAAVLTALGKTFPADLQHTALVLVGHGSPDPRAEKTYADFARLLSARYPGKNIFLGLVQFGKSGPDEIISEIKSRGVDSVQLRPFLLVAGEHVAKDILGDSPQSWKSKFQARGISHIEGVRQGLGYNDGIVSLYLDHLQAAMRELQP